MRFNSLNTAAINNNNNSAIAPTTVKTPAKTTVIKTPAKTTVIKTPATKATTKAPEQKDEEKVMKMVEKMFLTLTKFENAIEDLWMNKHIISMEQADLFSTFYAKDFLKKCMKKDADGVMFMYPNFVEEVTSIGNNFEIIEDYLDKSLIDDLLEFADAAQEL